MRNGIPTKYGIFVIHVTQDSLAERVGIMVRLEISYYYEPTTQHFNSHYLSFLFGHLLTIFDDVTMFYGSKNLKAFMRRNFVQHFYGFIEIK